MPLYSFVCVCASVLRKRANVKHKILWCLYEQKKRWLSLKYEISAVSLHFFRFCFSTSSKCTCISFSNELYSHSHKNYFTVSRAVCSLYFFVCFFQFVLCIIHLWLWDKQRKGNRTWNRVSCANCVYVYTLRLFSTWIWNLFLWVCLRVVKSLGKRHVRPKEILIKIPVALMLKGGSGDGDIKLCERKLYFNFNGGHILIGEE